MRNLLFTLTLLSIIFDSLGQSERNLSGICHRDSLLKEPYSSWFQANYDNYQPISSAMGQLSKLDLRGYSIDIFFGTWCGDSRRDVPRFFKIVDQLKAANMPIKLIAVESGERYKQSPGGETIGRSIYRVATFIVMKNGKEVNRITEHPVTSLEHDLLQILGGKNYLSNFKSYPILEGWMAEGLLTHPNTSLRGLAKQLKPILISPSELNACGHVLMAQSRLDEAIAIFRINAYIFYDQVDPYLSLATAYSSKGEKESAEENILRSFELNEDPLRWKELLKAHAEILTTKQ